MNSKRPEMPTATLSSGLVVGNYSSPHQFHFDDGSTLDACHPSRVRCGTLKVREDVVTATPKVKLVTVNHELTPKALDMIIEAANTPDVDLVIVPRVILSAAHQFIRDNHLRHGDELCQALAKCATVRVACRQTKAAYHNKFCV